MIHFNALSPEAGPAERAWERKAGRLDKVEREWERLEKHPAGGEAAAQPEKPSRSQPAGRTAPPQRGNFTPRK